MRGHAHLRNIRVDAAPMCPEDLGLFYLYRNQLAEAKIEFEAVLRLNPDDYQAPGSLGAVYLRERNLELAEIHLASALRLNPDDTVARRNLDLVRAGKRALEGGN